MLKSVLLPAAVLALYALLYVMPKRRSHGSHMLDNDSMVKTLFNPKYISGVSKVNEEFLKKERVADEFLKPNVDFQLSYHNGYKTLEEPRGPAEDKLGYIPDRSLISNYGFYKDGKEFIK